jgi:suppressor for copper-sensitivity B
MNSRLRPALALALALGGGALAPAAAPQAAREERASLRLTAGRTAFAAGEAARLEARVTVEDGWHVNSDRPTFDYLIPTTLAVEVPAGWPAARVEYPPAEMQTFAFADQPLAVWAGEVTIPVTVEVPAASPSGAAPVRARLRYQACSDTICLPPVETEASLALTIGDAAPAAAPAPGAAAAAPASLLGILAAGFLGGLILNLMPCVLPVLSLKVFGLVKSAGQGRAHVTRAALATSAGILASFWGLAAAAIAARAAGSAVGWGVQFQQPAFVAFLAVVVVVFCLNLWGVFEIPLPARLARLAGSAQGDGVAGHFSSGLFATLMATPCSAPFLGTAVSFALGQPPATVVAVFTAVGAGMALPYLLLAARPGAARWLPRPGAWMDTLKGFMGFLLAGTAVWLFYVLSAQLAPERLAFVQLALLLLALFAWTRHRVPGPAAKRAAAFAMLGAAALALWVASGAAPAAGERSARAAEDDAGPGRLVTWVPWDAARAEALARDGRLVFVDVTADWCFTCKVNERLAIETDPTAAAFARHQVVAMKADWTTRDDRIAEYLASFGRYGIPFYVLYRPAGAPHVFGEVLTQGELLRVVEESAAAAATGGAAVAAAGR